MYAINEILFYLHVTHAINGFQKKKKTHAINERLFIFHVMHASVHLLILSFIITKLKKNIYSSSYIYEPYICELYIICEGH